VFLLALAHTVPGAAQVVGTLLVLSLAITPGAVATDGGLLVSFEVGVKARVFITSISFAIYARLVPPALRDPRATTSVGAGGRADGEQQDVVAERGRAAREVVDDLLGPAVAGRRDRHMWS